MPKEKIGRRPLAAIAVILAAAAVLFGQFAAGENGSPYTALVLVLTVISLFATALIPEYLTVLIFFFLAMVFKAAPADVIFSGFQSTALWLVFTGLVIGAAIRATGLGRQMAQRLSCVLPASYTWMVAGIAASGLAFAFIMPSAMGRIMLLVPVTLAIADHFGFKNGSNGRTGLVLAATLGTGIPAFSILPSNVPNIILAGMAEKQLGIHILFFEYLVRNFPVFGVIKAVIIVLVILKCCPDRLGSAQNLKEAGADGMPDTNEPLGQPRDQMVLAAVLAGLIVLWMTDSIHHVSPAWVALGGAVLLMFPGIGPVSSRVFSTDINFSSLFFVAGVIGVGNLIRFSGLSDMIGRHLVAQLPLAPDTPFLNYLQLCFASAGAGLFTTLPGVPAVMTPLAPEMAKITGMSLSSVLMTQVVGFSTVFFPYQSPPLVVAMHISDQGVKKAFKPLLAVAVITCGLLIPLNYLWWQLTWGM